MLIEGELIHPTLAVSAPAVPRFVRKAQAAVVVSVPSDTTPPVVTVEVPLTNDILQGSVTFRASASDQSGVSSLLFSIREAGGGTGIPIGFENLPASQDATGKWVRSFNTSQVPDGRYVLIAKATDPFGKEGLQVVPFFVKNWQLGHLLPKSKVNRAGRTMPVKFALTLAGFFVRNEELTLKIFANDAPSTILQTSVFGDTARDYRITDLDAGLKSDEELLYITNFQTLRTAKTYQVDVLRKDFLIGSFTFSTTR